MEGDGAKKRGTGGQTEGGREVGMRHGWREGRMKGGR